VKHKRLTVGIITLVFILMLNFAFKYSTGLYDTLYFRGIFQFIRVVHDYTIGLLPIPSLYIIVPLFFTFFYYKKVGSIREFLHSTLTTLVWIVNFFYLLWGFNYTQPSLYKTLNLTQVSLDSIYIKETFIGQTKKVDSLATLIRSINGLELDNLESLIRDIQEPLIAEWGTPTIGRVRIRNVPRGSLLRIRTSGIYIPHAFEGHIDNGLYYKQHPFTIAHEMAHGYGYTDESVCNFIGYLTCFKSDNPVVKYSGELAYWRYLVRYFRYFYPDEWSTTYENLSPSLKEDLDEIRNHINQYKDLMPEMRDVIYDNYLKTHGVKAGIKSYDEMIQLIAAWRADGR